MIHYGLWAAGALTIGIGVLPVVAGLAALVRRRGEPRPQAERVFAAVFAAGLIGIGSYTAVKAAYISTVFSTLVEERNLIYVAPLIFVATAMWLERPRVRWWALAASAGFVLYLIVSTPYKMEFHFYADAPGLAILEAANRHFAWTPHTARVVLLSMLAISVVLIALPHFLGARRKEITAVVAAAAIGVLAWTMTAQISAATASNSFSNDFTQNISPPLDWLDKADGRQADALPRTEHRRPERALDPRVLEPLDQARVEPRRHRARSRPDPDPGSRGDGRPPLSESQGGLRGHGTGVDVVGTVVATHNHKNAASTIPWRLVKIAQPLRLAHAQTGIETDGWVVSPDGVKPAKAAYSQFVTPGKRRGYARVIVTRRGWGGTDVPGLVTVKLGKLVKGKDKQPALGKVLAVHRFWIHSREYKQFFIPAPRGPFRAEVTVSPTFVQSTLDPRIGDTRHLGAQVGFGWVPRIPRR